MKILHDLDAHVQLYQELRLLAMIERHEDMEYGKHVISGAGEWASCN